MLIPDDYMLQIRASVIMRMSVYANYSSLVGYTGMSTSNTVFLLFTVRYASVNSREITQFQ